MLIDYYLLVALKGYYYYTIYLCYETNCLPVVGFVEELLQLEFVYWPLFPYKLMVDVANNLELDYDDYNCIY